jgi:hypothetical protein
VARCTRSAAALVLLATLSAGCQNQSPSSSSERLPVSTPSASRAAAVASPASCPRRQPFEMTDPRITESSGLTRSTVHPGVLYTHNDAGGTPSVFAVDGSGTRAVLRVAVPAAIDWEDIASTPDGRLWIADTGDNELLRESVQLIVIQEPEVLVTSTVPATTYQLRYPDGPQDAEALLVDPDSDRVYLVTKDDEEGRVYQAPAELDENAVNVLREVGTAPPAISGGDFSPDGSLVVLRNQAKAYFSTAPGGDTTELDLPSQEQGESITFTADGDYVVMGSEGVSSTILCMPTPLGIEQ